MWLDGSCLSRLGIVAGVRLLMSTTLGSNSFIASYTLTDFSTLKYYFKCENSFKIITNDTQPQEVYLLFLVACVLAKLKYIIHNMKFNMN